MENTTLILSNQKGSTLLLVVMILLLVTLIGTLATNNSNIEIKIAGNYKAIKQDFYRADAATMEAVQRVQNSTKLNLRNRVASWMNDDAVNMTDFDNWDFDDIGGDDNAVVSGVDPNTVYSVVDNGATGNTDISIDNEPVMRDLTIYGVHNNPRGGQTFIEMGYKKKF